MKTYKPREIIRNDYRKQIEGEWIDKKCSHCGESELYIARGNFFATTFFQVKTKYCPNCGAKMKVGDDT